MAIAAVLPVPPSPDRAYTRTVGLFSATPSPHRGTSTNTETRGSAYLSQRFTRITKTFSEIQNESVPRPLSNNSRTKSTQEHCFKILSKYEMNQKGFCLIKQTNRSTGLHITVLNEALSYFVRLIGTSNEKVDTGGELRLINAAKFLFKRENQELNIIYLTDEKLGEGGRGFIYSALNVNKAAFRAVKLLKNPSAAHLEEIKHEIEMLRSMHLNHEGKWVQEPPEATFLITEINTGNGSLVGYMGRAYPINLHEWNKKAHLVECRNAVVQKLVDIFQNVVVVNNRRVGDIKPSNFLVDENDNVVLSDVGSVRPNLPTDTDFLLRSFTPSYVHPVDIEKIRSVKMAAEFHAAVRRVDEWGIFLTIQETLSGGLKAFEAGQKNFPNVSAPFNVQTLEGYSPEIRNLFSRALTHTGDRARFEELRKFFPTDG